PFSSALLLHPPSTPPLSPFPYTTLFRSQRDRRRAGRDPLLSCSARSDEPRAGRSTGERGRRRTASHSHTHLRDDGSFERGSEMRSEEHTSELQSRFDLVCRLLLEKKKNA